jgi:PAS domain S-box-containing protein
MSQSTNQVTGGMRVDAEIQRRLQEMTILNQITTVIASAADMTDALYRVCAVLARYLQVPQAGFAVFNRQRTAAEVVADYHPPGSPTAMGVEIPVADNPSMGYVLRHKVPFAATDAQTDPRLTPVHAIMRQRNVQSILIAPILVEGEVIGTLGLDAFQRREFSHYDIDLVQNVTSQVGQVLMRKRAADALRESEKKFRTLAEQSPNMIFINVKGKVVYANRRAEGLVGYSREELYAEDFDYLALVAPEHRELVRSCLRRHLEGDKVEPCEYAFVAKDGDRIEVIVATELIDYGGGRAVLGIATDVTERKRLEERARQRTAQLEAVRAVGLALTSELDLDTLLRSVVSQAMELLGGTSSGLYLYRPDRDVLEWAVGMGPDAPPVGAILRRGEGLSGMVWETGRHLIVEDYREWDGQATILEGRASLSVVGVPVRWGRELLGVINVGVPPSRGLSSGDAELLSLFATQAAIAIRNAQLFHSLEQAKRDWEVTFDTMRDAIALTDGEGRIVRVNRAFADLVQRGFPEIMGQMYHVVMDGAVCPEAACPLEQTMALGRPATCTHEYNGRILEVQTTPVSGESSGVPGRAARVIFGLRDITERTRMEEEREKLVLELQDALTKVKTLSGLLPICANCKKIRDDQGYWHSVEVYVKEHSEASFSHGICPDCTRELYPWFYRSGE